MIVLAMITLNFIHPWNYLYDTPSESIGLVSTQKPSDDVHTRLYPEARV